jgi:integrase-like protein
MRTLLAKLRGKRMRTRNQDGWVEETPARSWKAHWYVYVRDPETGKERRCHRSEIVGYKYPRNDQPAMRKFEAEDELRKRVAPVNATQSTRRDDRVSLRWFVEHRWKPTVVGNWGDTTRKTNEHFIRAILAKFGDKQLRELDRVELQDWLNEVAIEYSRSMTFHCHTYLKAICAEAIEQNFLAKNPSRKLKRPKTRKPDETMRYDLESCSASAGAAWKK